MENNTQTTTFDQLMDESDALIAEAKRILEEKGIVFVPSKWLTIKEYAKKHNLESTNVVSMWVKRGLIPQEDIREIGALNNLKLIRDKEYK